MTGEVTLNENEHWALVYERRISIDEARKLTLEDLTECEKEWLKPDIYQTTKELKR